MSPHLIPGAPLVATDPAGAVLPMAPCRDGPLAPPRLGVFRTVGGDLGIATPQTEFVITQDAVVTSWSLDGQWLRWVEESAVGRLAMAWPLQTSRAFAPGIRRALLFVLHGQSLQSGRNSWPVVNGGTIAPGRAVMFNGGVRPMGQQSEPQRDKLAGWRAVADLVDLREQRQGADGETKASGMAAWLLPRLPADTALIFVDTAIGAQPYAELCRGQEPWRNLVDYAARARLLCELQGVEMEFAGMVWCQGGADAGDTAEQYRDKMVELYGDLQDVAAMLGQGEAPLILSQMTHNTASPTMAVARGQAMAAREVPGIYCSGPEYLFPSCSDERVNDPAIPVDTTHLAALSQFWHGAYSARTWLQQDQPLWSTGPATLAGAVVSIPYGAPLLLEGSHVIPPAHCGVTWSGAAGITAVGACGAELKVHLSAPPAPGSYDIGIAMAATAEQQSWQGPINGARSSLWAASSDSIECAGRVLPMHRHACVELIRLEV